MKDLPQYGEWEVALVDVPGMSVQDVELAGVLLVVSHDDGMVLGAAPIPVSADLSGALLGIALEPALPMEAHRPVAILCHRESLASFAGAAVALGAQLRAARSLPALEDARDAIVGRFGSVDLVPLDPAPWAVRLRELVDAAPWRALSDQTLFVVTEGPEGLVGRAAIVLGNAAEQYGIVAYPSAQHFERLLYAIDDSDPMDVFEGWCAHLDPVEALDPSAREALRAADLVYEGFALVVFAAEPGAARELEDAEHAQLRAVTDGVLAAWRRVGADLEDTYHIEADVETELGPITVLVRPGSRADLIDLPNLMGSIRYRLLFHLGGDFVPKLVIKTTKRDAKTLDRRLEDVDGIALGDLVGGDEREILAFVDEEPVGLLALGPDEDELWDKLFAQGELDLVLAGGGPTRSRVREQDVISVRRVDVLEEDDDDDEEDEVDVGPDPAPTWPSEVYEGPIESWPKASETLLAFSWPTPIASLSPPQARNLLDVMATIWSGVVANDHDPEHPAGAHLTEALERAEAPTRAWFEDLVDRKRRWFERDHRLFLVEDVGYRDGELQVKVLWKSVHDA